MEITLTRFGICDENNKIKEIIHVRRQSMKGTITFAYKYVKKHYWDYEKMQIINCTFLRCKGGDILSKEIIKEYLVELSPVKSDAPEDEVLRNIINSDSDNATKGAKICCRMQTIYGINSITFMKNPSLIMDKFDRILWQQAFEEIYK